MTGEDNSRRKFSKQSSFASIGAALGLGITLPALSQPSIDTPTGNPN